MPHSLRGLSSWTRGWTWAWQWKRSESTKGRHTYSLTKTKLGQWVSTERYSGRAGQEAAEVHPIYWSGSNIGIICIWNTMNKLYVWERHIYLHSSVLLKKNFNQTQQSWLPRLIPIKALSWSYSRQMNSEKSWTMNLEESQWTLLYLDHNWSGPTSPQHLCHLCPFSYIQRLKLLQWLPVAQSNIFQRQYPGSLISWDSLRKEGFFLQGRYHML